MSETCKNWTQWLSQTRFASLSEAQRIQTLNWLQVVGDVIINNARIKEGDTVIDIGTGTGLLAFKALDALKGTGCVIFKIVLIHAKNLLTLQLLKAITKCFNHLLTKLIYQIKA